MSPSSYDSRYGEDNKDKSEFIGREDDAGNHRVCCMPQEEMDECIAIPLDEGLLSRHIMFLGSIGTGKTNAISQIIQQLRDEMSSEDVMIVFDSKGDFYNDFYRHGLDVVISNDSKSIGLNGQGYAIKVFTDAGIEFLGQQLKKDGLSDGRYATAFEGFADWCDQFFAQAKTGKPYDKGHMPTSR